MPNPKIKPYNISDEAVEAVVIINIIVAVMAVAPEAQI